MRVALIVNRFPVVSETFIYNKVVGLESAGVDVTVIRQTAAGDRSPGSHTVVDAPTRSLRGLVAAASLGRAALRDGKRSARHLPRGRRGASALLRSLPFAGHRYDCVHFEFSGLAVEYLDVLPLLSPVPVFVSCRGAAEQITPLVDERRKDDLRRVLRLVDRVHCVTADMLETLRRYGVDEDKAFINRPAIDLTRFAPERGAAPARAGRKVLLSTGRLHWKKGHEYALLALRRLLDARFDVEYRIVGAGPHEECLRFAVDDLRLADRVRFLGALASDDVRAQLVDADIFVLPSVSEGLSNAALEAMAMELPVVSTTAGGMPEAIEHGVDGILVQPRDAAGLASAIDELLRDDTARERLGRAARERVRRDFDIGRQVRVFVQEYEKAVAAARSRK